MPFTPQVDYLQLPSSRLGKGFDGLRILHLSDLHMTRWTRRLERWRETMDELGRSKEGPDMLVITGDLGHRSWHWAATLKSVEKLLEPLTPRLGTYFILGNHDSVKLGPALAATKDAAGRPRVWLQNEAVFLERHGATVEVWGDGEAGTAKKGGPRTDEDSKSAPPEAARPRIALIGVHQHRRIDTDIPMAMRWVRPDDFKVMLLHYPDLVHPATAAGADICLAGHTHGGQICWPDGSPLFGQDTLTPAMCTGVHKVNGTWMVVNRGIGVAGLRMRMFCPPHAVLMVLRSAND